MKSKFLIGLLIAFMGMISLSSCERIDAGHEGIKVSLYGDDKGVGEAALVTGRVWYNPFTTEIYEYPTYVRTVDYAPLLQQFLRRCGLRNGMESYQYMVKFLQYSKT